MPDQIKHANAYAGPAGALRKVTPSDTADLPDGPCRALLVGTAGDADLNDGGGAFCDAVPLQAGYNPICVTRVYSTGLTAANIWALY